MKNPVIAISSFVITMIVYASSPIFFEMNDNAYGEGVKYIVFYDQNYKSTAYNEQQQPQLVEKECKSPCPDFDEMCITMCA
jgi:hypothetical protein